VYYKDNETKYKVLPKLIIPELACTSCFEDSDLWHRAMVMKIVDDENVQVIKICKHIIVYMNLKIKIKIFVYKLIFKIFI